MTAPRVEEAMEEEEVFTPLKKMLLGLLVEAGVGRRQVWRANFFRLVSWRVAEADQPVVVICCRLDVGRSSCWTSSCCRLDVGRSQLLDVVKCGERIFSGWSAGE